MNRHALPLAAVAATLLLAFPASAGFTPDPELISSPTSGKPGAKVTLSGQGWTGCSAKVALYFRQGDRRLKLGDAVHGNGAFSFSTHIQGFAEPGPARFSGRQKCGTEVYAARADVRVKGETTGDGDETVRYIGSSRAGRVSFQVVDGTEVRRFRFVNKCPADSKYGTLVPGAMRIGDISFSRRGQQFKIFGRFYADGTVRGRARNITGNCDSGRLNWTAVRR